jgi:hypothetical protein
MIFNIYRLTLRHDTGRYRVVVCARCPEDAAAATCKAERCPRRAITQIKLIKNI